ncbi:MAG: phosphatase PAP2 family protein [Cyanobacteria bacterium P01_H01_bin.15]
MPDSTPTDTIPNTQKIPRTRLLWWALCTGLVSGLIYLIKEVSVQNAFPFDAPILLWIHRFSSPTLDKIMLAITRLGNPSTTLPLVLLVLTVLLWQRRWRFAGRFFVACSGSIFLIIQLKLFFGKARPELWPQLVTESTYSFPSGHAVSAVVLYGFIAYMLSDYRPKWAAPIYGLATFLIGAIGFSRLYLGVHWPTDVLAGYGIGFLWLFICIGLFRSRR